MCTIQQRALPHREARALSLGAEASWMYKYTICTARGTCHVHCEYWQPPRTLTYPPGTGATRKGVRGGQRARTLQSSHMAERGATLAPGLVIRASQRKSTRMLAASTITWAGKFAHHTGV